MNTQDVISIFYQKLQTIPDILILKNAATPQTIPDTGLIMLGDGKNTIIQTILSPVSYIVELRPELEVLVQNSNDDERCALTKEIVGKIAKCFEYDYTLDGAVDYLHFEMPEYADEDVDGAPPIRFARIPVIIEFISNNPLI